MGPGGKGFRRAGGLTKECVMSDEPKAKIDVNALSDRRFSDMTPGEKLRFIGKALVFLISGGFIYPTLWVD